MVTLSPPSKLFLPLLKISDLLYPLRLLHLPSHIPRIGTFISHLYYLFLIKLGH
jgi:hypothetical protein